MARTADDQRRAELLGRIVDYVMEHGIADLSLRPLADAVGTSPRIVLYYFGSKEGLLVEVMSAARGRQRAVFDELPRAAASYGSTVRAAWELMSARAHEPVFRLFFEIYGLALQNPVRYADFLRGAVDDWIGYLEASQRAAGHAREDARAIATVILAGYRGFLLDLLATHDRARIARAVELWIGALDALPDPGSALP